MSEQEIELTENARVVLERRYLAKDDDGNVVETPAQLFRRVADNIARAEERYLSETASPQERDGATTRQAETFYDLLTSLRFLPNSPTLGNAGRPLQQLSACFVLPVEDSIAGIFETIKETALIHQSGGGTGFAFSRLRPAGDTVQTTSGVASGPVSFMKVFDAATEAIKQGGTRRGANMAILDVHHPDIEAFINVKADMVTLTNFNISVAADDTFMSAVQDDTDYDLVSPRSGEIVGRRRARAVFDQIVANAWQNGDPGLVFIDRINRDHPTPALGRIEATNPCGEQPLLPYESCNLGSLNLARFVRLASSPSPQAERGPGGEVAGREVDWDGLGETIPLAVRFLDDVIDMSLYPVEAIDRVTKQTRKIGLGLMGWADLLFQLRIPYDSEEALLLADRLMAYVRERADAASAVLAAERDAFPAWEDSIYGPASVVATSEAEAGAAPMPRPLGRGPNSQTAAASEPPMLRPSGRGTDPRPLRNSTRTTIAPTGTLSIIAGCSGGIEPAFALAFTRQHYLDPKQPDRPVRLTEVNPVFAAVAQEHGFYSQDLIDHLAAGGSLRQRDDVPDWAKRVFVTAHEIEPDWHVRMQASFQRHTDNAVSKTINFPRHATVPDVAGAYLRAFDMGCKGITIYRDGSRGGQVLTHIADSEDDLADAPDETPLTPPALTATSALGLAPSAPLPDLLAPFAAAWPEADLVPDVLRRLPPDFSPAAAESPHRRRLPDERQSITHKFRVGEQEGFITVGLFEDGSPGEIFVTISKEGSTIRGLMDSVAMLTSYTLQYGVSLSTLVDKFKGVHFEPAGFTANPEVPQAASIVDYIFRWLERKFLSDADVSASNEPAPQSSPPRPEGRAAPARRRRRYVPPGPDLPFSEIATGLLCPDCGSQIIFAEGCLVCRACGYTKCG